MTCPEFVQSRRPALPPGTRPSPARVVGQLFPRSGPPIPAPRPFLEEGDGTRVGNRAASPGRTPSLNQRDLELLRHLADGRSTGQIAAAMSVTSNTTRTRIRRVQRKLGAARRTQVVVAARQFGVV
jgi:DNA-binding CsgD family transcriptional regulator